jgi:hypothetical protein
MVSYGENVAWSAVQLPSHNSLYVIDFNSGSVNSQTLHKAILVVSYTEEWNILSHGMAHLCQE